MPRLEHPQLAFPYLCLLVSGGHTLLTVVHGIGNYTQLGTTLDDSIGEAFDKVYRQLCPAWESVSDAKSPGQALELLARTAEPPATLSMPMPLEREVPRSMNFSFSGLKTHVKRLVEKELQQSAATQLSAAFKASVASAFQETAFSHLLSRVRAALDYCRAESLSITSVVVSGGVAQNACLIAR